MENLSGLKKQLAKKIGLTVFGALVISGATLILLVSQNGSRQLVALIFIILSALLATLSAVVLASYASTPIEALGRAVLHISPGMESVKAPSTDSLRLGQEYVSNIIYQLYQIASIQRNQEVSEHRREATQASNILAHIPMPIFVFNKEQKVTFASDMALSYCQMVSSELFGKQLFDAIDLEFPSEFTLDEWVNDCQKNRVSDTANWRRVRFALKHNVDIVRNLDISGYYNRDNPSGIEFIITMFDRSEEYAQDEASINSMALTVHEIRLPLTNLRGYIEALKEDLSGKLDAEAQVFMDRLQASAQQLNTFVNNILSVSKLSADQLSFKLAEERASEIVAQVLKVMSVSAETAGKIITVDMPANLPTVGADRGAIVEVLTNLIDNAIKYSGVSKEIKISANANRENFVEISIQDQGVGIPGSVLPTLFEKFQRNHRNRTQIAGSGLGLYLCKAIVKAHGGEIAVDSKENAGTKITFGLQTFASLADESKNVNNNSMVRTAHGWIKNHSLYRR